MHRLGRFREKHYQGRQGKPIPRFARSTWSTWTPEIEKQ